MNPELFFQETTPLTCSTPVQESFCCNSLSPNQRYQLKKTAFIIGGIFAVAILLYSIYDGVKSFEARPLKTMDAVFAGAQMTLAASAFFFYSAFAGIHLGRYQNLVESYPQESYQGSLAKYFEEGFIGHRHHFVIENGKQFIPMFISKFEPALLDRYFLIKKIENSEEKKIEFLCNELERGCCFGHSMALLAKMKNHAKTSSEELLNSISIENIIYCQLTNSILWDLRNDQDSSFYPALYSYYQDLTEREYSFSEWMNHIEEMLIQRRRESRNVKTDAIDTDEDICITNNKLSEAEGIKSYDNLFEHKRLFFNFCGFDSASIFIHEVKNKLKISELHCFNLSIHFDTAQQEIVNQARKYHYTFNQMTMAGYIYIQRPENKEYEGIAHAIFFQISDGYFRFYDSASQLNHFFEFPTQELMFEGLKSHMKECWNSFKMGEFQLVIVGIPHSKLVIN